MLLSERTVDSQTNTESRDGIIWSHGGHCENGDSAGRKRACFAIRIARQAIPKCDFSVNEPFFAPPANSGPETVQEGIVRKRDDGGESAFGFGCRSVKSGVRITKGKVCNADIPRKLK
jgi:hypothetical protein